MEWAARPPTLYPHQFTWNNYLAQFVQLPLEAGAWYAAYAPPLKYLFNSSVVVSLAILLTLAVSLYLSYSMVKMRGISAKLYGSLILVDAIPRITMATGFLLLFTIFLRLYDTYLGLSIAYMGEVLGLSMLLLVLFYRRVSPDIEESMRLAGCSETKAYLLNVFNNCKTALVLVIFFTFMFSWQDFTYALLLTNFNTTATVWLSALTHEVGELFGMRSALSMLIAIPALAATWALSSKMTEYYPVLIFSEFEAERRDINQIARKLRFRRRIAHLPGLLIYAVLLPAPLAMVLGYWLVVSSVSIADGLHALLRSYNIVLSDPAFINSLYRTSLIVIITLAALCLLGLLTIYFLTFDRSRRWRGHLTLLTIPAFVPPIVSGYAFRIIFYPDGPAESIASLLGIGKINWLADPYWAFIAVVIANLWSSLPTVLLLLYGAARTVPEEAVRVATSLGASNMTILRTIVVPYVWKYLLFAALLVSIHTFELMDIPFIMTYGGPGDATRTVSLQIYLAGIKGGSYSYLSASSAIVALIQGAFAIFALSRIRRG